MAARQCTQCGEQVAALRLVCPSCRKRTGPTTPARVAVIAIIAIAIGLFLGNELAPKPAAQSKGGDCRLSGEFDLTLCDGSD